MDMPWGLWHHHVCMDETGLFFLTPEGGDTPIPLSLLDDNELDVLQNMGKNLQRVLGPGSERTDTGTVLYRMATESGRRSLGILSPRPPGTPRPTLLQSPSLYAEVAAEMLRQEDFTSGHAVAIRHWEHGRLVKHWRRLANYSFSNKELSLQMFRGDMPRTREALLEAFAVWALGVPPTASEARAIRLKLAQFEEITADAADKILRQACLDVASNNVPGSLTSDETAKAVGFVNIDSLARLELYGGPGNEVEVPEQLETAITRDLTKLLQNRLRELRATRKERVVGALKEKEVGALRELAAELRTEREEMEVTMSEERAAELVECVDGVFYDTSIDPPAPFWITGPGKALFAADFTDDHLKSAIKYIQGGGIKGVFPDGPPVWMLEEADYRNDSKKSLPRLQRYSPKSSQRGAGVGLSDTLSLLESDPESLGLNARVHRQQAVINEYAQLVFAWRQNEGHKSAYATDQFPSHKQLLAFTADHYLHGVANGPRWVRRYLASTPTPILGAMRAWVVKEAARAAQSAKRIATVPGKAVSSLEELKRKEEVLAKAESYVQERCWRVYSTLCDMPGFCTDFEFRLVDGRIEFGPPPQRPNAKPHWVSWHELSPKRRQLLVAAANTEEGTDNAFADAVEAATAGLLEELLASYEREHIPKALMHLQSLGWNGSFKHPDYAPFRFKTLKGEVMLEGSRLDPVPSTDWAPYAKEALLALYEDGTPPANIPHLIALFAREAERLAGVQKPKQWAIKGVVSGRMSWGDDIRAQLAMEMASLDQTAASDNAASTGEDMSSEDVSTMTKDELRKLIEAQKKQLAATEQEVKTLRSTREIGVDLAKDTANALAMGGQMAVVAAANKVARDQLVAGLPPAWVAEQWVQNAMLVVPPGVLMAILDFGPHFGLPIPETGRKEVRRAAELALIDAGKVNAEELGRKVMELLMPMWVAYQMAGAAIIAQESRTPALGHDRVRDITEDATEVARECAPVGKASKGGAQ